MKSLALIPNKMDIIEAVESAMPIGDTFSICVPERDDLTAKFKEMMILKKEVTLASLEELFTCYISALELNKEHGTMTIELLIIAKLEK